MTLYADVPMMASIAVNAKAAMKGRRRPNRDSHVSDACPTAGVRKSPTMGFTKKTSEAVARGQPRCTRNGMIVASPVAQPYSTAPPTDATAATRQHFISFEVTRRVNRDAWSSCIAKAGGAGK
jgi:hypothetical protein